MRNGVSLVKNIDNMLRANHDEMKDFLKNSEKKLRNFSEFFY